MLLLSFKPVGYMVMSFISFHFSIFSQASLGVASTLASFSEINGEQVDRKNLYEMIKTGMLQPTCDVGGGNGGYMFNEGRG